MPVLNSTHESTTFRVFREKGWSTRTAAKRLGVHHAHLHRVLTGERISASLSRRIESLPIRKPAN